MSRVQPTSENAKFHSDVHGGLVQLRQALRAIVVQLGFPTEVPLEFSRRSGLDKNLAWKLCKLLTEVEAPLAVPHLLGRPGWKIALRRFTDLDLPRPLLESLENAIQNMEAIVERHSGDRDTFIGMVSSGSVDVVARMAEAARKLSFRGNATTWGVRAMVQIGAHFVGINRKDPDRLDLAVVSGLTELERLRPEVPWSVASITSIHDDGGLHISRNRSPLDNLCGELGTAPFLREFCTNPLPQLRVVETPNGPTRYQVVGGALGATGSITSITGFVDRSCVNRYAEPNDRLGELLVLASTPVEVMVHDVYFHTELLGGEIPTVALYSQLPGGPTYPSAGRDHGVLPLHDRVIELGSPPEVNLAEYDSMPALVASVFQKCDWNPSEFVGYRLKLRYPPIPSMSVMRYELPLRSA